MKSTVLYEQLQAIDDDILLRSEQHQPTAAALWRRMGVAAACLCLLCTAAFLTAHVAPSEPSDPQSLTPDIPPAIIFNSVSTMSADSTLRSNFCIFGEPLHEEELLAVCPASLPNWAEQAEEACALYYGWGELESIHLAFQNAAHEAAVDIILRSAEQPVFSDYILPVVATETIWGDFRFTAYRYTEETWAVVGAEFEREGVAYQVSVTCSPDTLDEAEADLRDFLTCYAATQTVPDLSAFVMREQHIWIDQPLTLAEAQNDSSFGSYFLPGVPAGWSEESLRRYQDDNNNYLAGLWTRGYDSLSWRVRFYTQADAVRLTSVQDEENYDLSRYPIPRADSVPAHLREIVDDPIFSIDELTLEAVKARAYRVEETGDTNAWRMAFSVLYGDTLVQIRTKGLSPEWVYETLQSLSPSV